MGANRPIIGVVSSGVAMMSRHTMKWSVQITTFNPMPHTDRQRTANSGTCGDHAVSKSLEFAAYKAYRTERVKDPHPKRSFTLTFTLTGLLPP